MKGQNAENEAAMGEVAVPADDPMKVGVAVGQVEVDEQKPVQNEGHGSHDYTCLNKCNADLEFELTLPIKQQKNKWKTNLDS